jgi:hypothetical protein
MIHDRNEKADRLTAPNRCRLCGTPVEGRTTLWCVECYRLHTHRCPTCRDARGKTLPRFRRRGTWAAKCCSTWSASAWGVTR